MQRSCAWCGRPLEAPDEDLRAGTTAHHRICPACRGRMITGSGIVVGELLDSLSEPALLIDADHTVGIVNDAALELLGVRPDDALSERVGTLFECENAHLPGSCGATMRCSGCQLRDAVARTHISREPHADVTTTLRAVDEGHLSAIDLVVSTLPVGDRVLLTIQRFSH